VTIDDATVADIGAGTGRIARLVAPRARALLLVERAAPMLAVATARLEAMGVAFTAHIGDARSLPLDTGVADVAIAAWVFGHFRHWMPHGWRDDVGRAITEMDRVTRPGGRIVVIETLGTGHTEPRRHEALDEYFAELEARWGFRRSWVRTDYVFESVDRAVEVCRPFFGEALAAAIRENGWSRVPECTAFFVRDVPPRRGA